MKQTQSVSPLSFSDFGAFLKYLRRRAQLTQTELAIACGYSPPHISHLENNQRLPDEATLLALFVPALDLENEPELAARLLELAREARGERVSHPLEIKQSTPAPTQRPMPSTPEERNRYAMLQNVRKFWVEGVLVKSLYVATMIELGLKHHSGKVESPWEMLFRQIGVEDETLPPETRILDIFEQLNGKLLILGDPGSGKTTTLLELARDLLIRAEADDTYPIPVVLNLSSWGEERQPFQDWLIDELSSKYQSPRKVARVWMESDALLLLLDGLDEVGIEFRDECVQAINAYRVEHGFVDMVICSRTADYDRLSTLLRLNGAVVIKPLDDGQIDLYLRGLGSELTTIHKLLEQDKTLYELCRSPLMLSILVLAYRGISSKEMPRHDTLTAQRKHLFNVYIRRMFERRGSESSYTHQQTIHYLGWLAHSMTEYAQSVFQIEHIQPSLLTDEHRDWFYRKVRLVTIVAMIVMCGIPFIPLAFALQMKWWILAPLNALAGATFAWSFTGDNWNRAPVLLLNGLIGGLTWGLSTGLTYGATKGIVTGIAAGILYLLGPYHQSITFAKQKQSRLHIVPQEVIYFSRANVKPLAGLLGVVTGIILTLGATWGFTDEPPDRASLILGLINGATIYGVWYVFQSGLTSEKVEHHVQPNQGIRASLKNAYRAGFMNGAHFQVVGLLALAPTLGLLPGLIFGAAHAISLGFVYWFIFGGLSVIQHVILRRILQRAGVIPLNLAHFLDYATSLLFLRRVGGSYIFIHRYLQEHFVTLYHS